MSDDDKKDNLLEDRSGARAQGHQFAAREVGTDHPWSDETLPPTSIITLDRFCQRLVDSELMDQEQVTKYRDAYQASEPFSFARELVNQHQLTRFQATVLLEGRDLPLVLDRYVILDEIGKGGMGAVFKALHRQMDRVVAIKILPHSAVDSADKIKRFQREVKAAASLEHPNIVTAFDAHESKKTHFLVMSFGDGQDLAKRVRLDGPFSISDAVHCIAQAARGLEHAHKLGVVHRDVKPANLLLDSNGTVKILDMGLARIDARESGHAHSQDLTQTGMMMGTVSYLAPEQALDTRRADARSDMYSLGCTLHFLLTGDPPYNEDTMMKVLIAHREGTIPSLRESRSGVSVELDTLFQKMLAKNPEDRFQNMTELLKALQLLELDEKDDEGAAAATKTLELPAPALHETATAIDTSRDVIAPEPAASQPPRRRNRGLIVACLLAFAGLGGAWAAGILFKIETKAGTIILEIDQPEIAGAEVTVDGQQKITIKTGAGQEPIEVKADEKTHTLQVVKGGFETFTTSFSVKAGGNELIKVRLEPLQSQQDAPTSMELPPPDVAATNAKSYALSFDGRDDYLDIPSLRIDASAPLTFEAWCTVSPNKPPEEEFLDPLFVTNSLTDQKSAYILIAGRPDGSYWMANQTLNDGRAASNQLYYKKAPISEHHHIAAVWTATEKRIYLNGTLVAQGTKPMIPLDTDFNDAGQAPTIGKANLLHRPLERFFNGTIDELRISSSAKFDTDFTPKKRFDRDDDTLVLYHFDEGAGGGVTDSSGNGNHGSLHGASWTTHPAVPEDIQLQKRNDSVAQWVLSIGGWVATPEARIEKPESLRPGDVMFSATLSGNERVTDEDLAKLTELEHLNTLSLSHTQISDAGMVHVGKIRTLERLDLQSSKVTGKGFRELAALLSLKTLWANGLKVSNSNVEALAACTRLEQLSLSDPELTDEAVEHLKALKSLQSLNLSGTSVSEKGKESLRAAIPGCVVK